MYRSVILDVGSRRRLCVSFMPSVAFPNWRRIPEIHRLGDWVCPKADLHSVK
jgi:hypothetical protein